MEGHVEMAHGKAENEETGNKTGSRKGTQSLRCCSPSKINLLLAFVSSCPRALPASSIQLLALLV